MNAGPVENWVAGLLSPDSPAAPGGAAEHVVAVAPTAASSAKAPESPPVARARGDEPTRFVTFRVDQETYALDVLRVREVLRSAEVVPVPGAPDSVLGVINLRGSIVPVVDARHRLGLAPPLPDASGRVLIIESGWQSVGLRVDSVAEVTTISAEECEPPPAVGRGEQSRCLRGVVRRDEEFMILVDVDDLLPRPVTPARETPP